MILISYYCVCAGAQCCVELRKFAEAIQWCDDGLAAHPADKKLQELRAAADKHKVQSATSANDLEGKAALRTALKQILHPNLPPDYSLFIREQQTEMPGRPRPKEKSCMVRKKLFWLL